MNPEWTEEDQKALEATEINYCFSCAIDDILLDNGFRTLGDVADCTREELLHIEGIGESRVEEIDLYLCSQGLQLSTGFKQ